MITQEGYEIDSQGNVGNETIRVEDLLLRFIALMMVINSNPVMRLETKQMLSIKSLNTFHKESGIPKPELISLIKRMTKEVEAIIANFKENGI